MNNGILTTQKTNTTCSQKAFQALLCDSQNIHVTFPPFIKANKHDLEWKLQRNTQYGKLVGKGIRLLIPILLQSSVLAGLKHQTIFIVFVKGKSHDTTGSSEWSQAQLIFKKKSFLGCYSLVILVEEQNEDKTSQFNNLK